MIIKSRDLALISVFAAFYPIVQLMNLGFPIIGGPGIINLALILGPINGLMLGPINGLIATAIGATIGMAMGIGTSFSPLVILNRSLGAAEAGMLLRETVKISENQKTAVPGWILAIIVLAAVSCLWYLFPVGRGSPLYPLLHLTGMLAALLLDGRASRFLSSSSRTRVALAVAVASYCAVLTDHMLGTIIFISVMGLQSPRYSVIFMNILPVTAIERITLASLATLFGTPILLLTRSLGIRLKDE